MVLFGAAAYSPFDQNLIYCALINEKEFQINDQLNISKEQLLGKTLVYENSVSSIDLIQIIKNIIKNNTCPIFTKFSFKSFEREYIKTNLLKIVCCDIKLFNQINQTTSIIEQLQNTMSEESIKLYLINNLKNKLNKIVLTESETIYPSSKPLICNDLKLILNNTAIKEIKLINQQNSLFEKIKFTKTIAGKNRLKFDLLNPFTKIENIKCRQENVEKLICDNHTLTKIRTILSEMPNINSLIANIIKISKLKLKNEENIEFETQSDIYFKNSQSSKNNLIYNNKDSESFIKSSNSQNSNIDLYPSNSIDNSLLIVKTIKYLYILVQKTKDLILNFNILKIFKLNTFNLTHEEIKIFERYFNYIHNNLDLIINPAFDYSLNHIIFNPLADILSPNIDPYLDLAKTVYSKRTSELEEILVEYKKLYNLEIHNDPEYGGCLKENKIFSKKENKNIKENEYKKYKDLFAVKENKKFIVFSNSKLKLLNYQSIEAFNQIIEISSNFLKEYIFSLNYFSDNLISLDKFVIELDILQSFATYSKTINYCFPNYQFDENIVKITKSEHPTFKNPVKNSFFISDKLNFNIFISPNMSGKTSYVKHLVNIILLSQIGSPIPAESAKLEIFYKIFFINKIEDIKDLLQQLNTKDKKLLIIDELKVDISILEILCKRIMNGNNIYTYFLYHNIEIIPKIIEYSNKINIIYSSNFSTKIGLCKNISAIEIASNFLPNSIINLAKNNYKLIKKEFIENSSEIDKIILKAKDLINEK